MKTAKLFLVILIAIVCQSCSSDSDIDPEPTIDDENGIHYKVGFHPLNTAIIKKKEFDVWNHRPSVYIRLFNADEIDFEFMRPDGEIITGRYKATYSNVSTEI
jgi:hypothetical protein